MGKIKVTKQFIVSLMDNGYTRRELASRFEVSVGQIAKLMDKLGLKGYKATKFDFEIIQEPTYDIVDAIEPLIEEEFIEKKQEVYQGFVSDEK
jgi:DNA-binding MurR/RpiR family transcriptional regulator